MTQSGGFITVAEAARRLNRSIEQVRRYLREGKLKGARVGQQWFVEEASLGLVYRQKPPRLLRVQEPQAVMEAPKVERKMEERLLNEELIARVDSLREEIRRKYGTFDDVVEMIRRSRQEH